MLGNAQIEDVTSLLTTKNNSKLLELAKRYMPGGVNSPVRSFNHVSLEPIFIQQGKGPYLFDILNNKYVDYVCSWGAMVNGHAHPTLTEKLTKAIQQGLSFGANTVHELALCQKIQELLPNLEMMRMVNSGTEATMSAIRLSRGFTGKQKIIKFIGCYHGHVDSLLIAAGSGVLTCNINGAQGVPDSIVQHTITVPYNDLESLENAFKLFGDDIAAVIVEPIVGNMNMILPQDGFLQKIRELCTAYKSLLIFDEVMTGFRVDRKSAQGLYNIVPDLTCLGKIIGSGMPVGAFGGRREIMQYLAPIGPVYQAGTLSGNPIAMQAGLANLELLYADNNFEAMNEHTIQATSLFRNIGKKYGIEIRTVNSGGMFGFFFMEDKDNIKFKKFFAHMLQHGIYLPPSPYEACFTSTAHGNTELEILEKALHKSFTML